MQLDIDAPSNTPEAFRSFMTGVHAALLAAGFSEHQRMAAEALMGGQARNLQRMFLMVMAWHSGKTLEDVGTMFNVTRERVRQIIEVAKALGVIDPSTVGGESKSVIVREREIRAAKKRRFEKTVQQTFGVDAETFVRLNDGKQVWRGKNQSRSRANIYFMQRRAALLNGSEWNLNFAQWCAAWDEQPWKWRARGRGHGKYALARLDSSKPFEVGNIALLRAEQVGFMAGAMGHSLNTSSAGEPSGSLKAKQDEVRRLHDEEKLSMAEAGARVGIQPGTAASYASASRRRMRNDGKEVHTNARSRPRKLATLFPKGSLGDKLTNE